MTSPTDDRLCRTFDYAADADSIALARRDTALFVIEKLATTVTGSPDQVRWLIERLRLIVSELCTNAVEAAPGEWFRVDISIDDEVDVDGSSADRSGRVTCTVTNPDAAEGRYVLEFEATPDPLAERGRGLLIVGGLANRARAVSSEGKMVVTAELDLGGET